MASVNNIGALRDARGWSRPELGRRMGTSGQQVERLEKGQRRLTQDWIDKAASAFEVSPAQIISPEDVTPPSNATVVQFEGDGMERPEENLPVWGSGLGAARMFDGEAVEQTDLNSGEVLEYVRRPAVLKGKKGVYGLHVQGSSMHPALPDGELLIAGRDLPLSIGDNVVVYLAADDDGYDGQRARGVLVKELVRRSASYVELRQYDPPLTFRVAMAEVTRIDRVLTRREMVS